MVKDNKKLRFNVVDLIIVLFMALAVVGIFRRYNIADQLNLAAFGETFEVEFVVRNIMRGTEHYLQAGETFHITIESIPIGVVEEIWDVRDAVEYVQTVEGDILRSSLPNRVDVTGIMISSGRTTRDGNIMINGNAFITTGSQFFIHTGRREVQITVLDVRPRN